MKKKHLKFMCTAICIAVLGSFLILGCEDQSDDIPTYSPGDDDLQAIWALMIDGWDHYGNGYFEDAQDCFRAANQRNAAYLPAYNGLGWCAVRLNDFVDAEIQLSFITTLADPSDPLEVDLLADAYAGLCLSATIERLFMEITGEGDEILYNELSRESIEMALTVFDLVGEDYAPEDHDPGFGSQSLHLMNAQNYFYLQEFGESEFSLAEVDPDFVADQVEAYGVDIADEVMELAMQVTDSDTSWILTPAFPAIHDVESLVPDDPGTDVDYEISFGVNDITIIPAEGVEVEEGDTFTVTYRYIDDLPQYLNDLIAHIQSLIQL
jgi:hypothetical protein